MSEESQVPPGSSDAPPPPSGDGSAPPPPAGGAPPPPPGGSAPPPPGGAAPPPTGGASPGGSGGSVSENRSVFLVLAYLGPFALIPFFMEKDDAEVQWHAKHGLVLTLAGIVLWVVLQIMSVVASAVLGPLACFGCFAFIALFVGQLGLHVACIIKAMGGERLTIPGLSDFADQF